MTASEQTVEFNIDISDIVMIEPDPMVDPVEIPPSVANRVEFIKSFQTTEFIIREEKYTISSNGDLVNSRGETCKIATFETPTQISSQSKIISGSNALQQTISTYPAIQYFGNSFGLRLPNVSGPYMGFAHILTGVTKFIYSLAKLGEDSNPGLLASSIIPTVQYVASTMVTSVFKDLNQNKELCAVHGALQIALNDLAKTAYLYSTGDVSTLQSSVPSILYGGLHIVASCGENKIQSNHTQAGVLYSAGTAFVVGTAVMTYNLAPLSSVQAFPTMYQLEGMLKLGPWMITSLINYQNYAALLKGITAAAVTDRLIKVLFQTYDNNIPIEHSQSTNSSNHHYDPPIELAGDRYDHISNASNMDISVTPNGMLKDLFFQDEMCTLADYYEVNADFS